MCQWKMSFAPLVGFRPKGSNLHRFPLPPPPPLSTYLGLHHPTPPTLGGAYCRWAVEGGRGV